MDKLKRSSLPLFFSSCHFAATLIVNAAPFCRLILQVLIAALRGLELGRITTCLFPSCLHTSVCFQPKSHCSETCLKPTGEEGAEVVPGRCVRQGCISRPLETAGYYLISPACNYRCVLAVSQRRGRPFRTQRRPQGVRCNRISDHLSPVPEGEPGKQLKQTAS